MSDYNPAEHAYCHVCGRWTRLTRKRVLYRHRYGGAPGSGYCVGGGRRVSEIIPGFTGPYVRDPRPVDRGEPHEDDRQAWWMEDFARGYRAHLPHPYSTLQGDSGCFICGGHADRKIHDDTPENPYQRISLEAWKAEQEPPPSEQPKPQFTDTSWKARMERLRNTPAVSTPLRGDPETTNPNRQENTMNLNITTGPGVDRKHRVVIQSKDGTQGVFCESNDLPTAIVQASHAVLSGATAASFAGVTLQDESPRNFRGRTAVTPEKIRELFEFAIEQQEYVKVSYEDVVGSSSEREVFPLRVSEDGLAVMTRLSVPRQGYRRLLFSRIQTAEIEA